MTVAVMQPYFFPYLPFFQLIREADVFVFLDNVNFIKKGWINRNTLPGANGDFLMTVPCCKISQNKLICDTFVDWDSKQISNILNTIRSIYSKSPYFDNVFEILRSIFATMPEKISDLAIMSIRRFCEYFRLECKFITASECSYYNNDLKGQDRIIDIALKEDATVYVNAIGGLNLYDKDYFKSKNLELKFLKTKLLNRSGGIDNYVSFHSSIDIAMNNSPTVINNYLQQYELI